MPADPKANALMDIDPFLEEDDELGQIEQEVAAILDSAAAQPAAPQQDVPVAEKADMLTVQGKADPLPMEETPALVPDVEIAKTAQAQPVAVEEPAERPMKRPAKQARKDADPQQELIATLRKYATMDGRKAFISLLEKDEATRQAWISAKPEFRTKLVKSWVDAEAKRFAREAAKQVNLKGLKASQIKQFYKRLEDRRKADLMQQLTPLIGINVATAINDPMANPNLALPKILRRSKLPASQEELLGWVGNRVAENPGKWDTLNKDGHKQYLKSLKAKYLLEAQQALQASPAFQAMSPKDRKAALKALKDMTDLQFQAVEAEVVGNYNIGKEPKQAVKEAINAKTAADPETAGILNYAGVALGAATAGVGDLVSFSGDVMAYVTGDGSWRDMALAKIGRDVADWGRKVQEENIPEHVKQELSQLHEKLKKGQVVDAFNGLSWSAYAIVGTQMAGYIAGSGGLAGGARAAAVKLATAKSIGAGLRAERVAKALSSTRAKTVTIAAGTGGAQGAEAGNETAQAIAKAPIDELKATPGWARMVEKLTAATGTMPTDVEVRNALADLHASRASVHGAGVSAASTLLLGGITENMLGALPLGATRQLFPAIERAGGRVAAGAKGAVREGASEFVEEGGLQAVQQYETAKATGGVMDTEEIIASGLAGAGFGALFGGAISAAAPLARDNIDNDPDIAEAKDEAAAQALDAIRIANEKAGNKPPKELKKVFSRPVQASDVEFNYTTNDNETRLATIAGQEVKKVGDTFYFGEKKINPEDPYWRSIIAEAERQAELAPGTIYNPQPADARQQREEDLPENRRVEALDVPDEALMDADAAVEQLFDEETVATPKQDVEPAQEQDLQPPPGMDNGDMARAFVNMLVKSGEPEAMAIESAIKTFGRRNVPEDIQETYKDIDPEIWAKEIEPLQQRADARHVEELKKALPAEGRYYVVSSAAEMPGMNPGAAIASFNINGGKDAFTVVNAAAIKSKRHLQQVFTAHHAIRAFTSPKSGELLLQGAIKAVERGMHLRVKKPTKKGYIDYTQEHPIPNIKSPKTQTAQYIMQAFQERLRQGDKEALFAMREAINGLLEQRGMPQMGRYISYSQLWRTLLEAGIIPRTELADVAAAPPGTPPPPRNTLPEGDDGGNKKKATLDAPMGVTAEGWMMKVIRWADNAYKLNVYRSLAEQEGVHEEMRQKAIEFVNTARGMSSIANEYTNFLADIQVGLEQIVSNVAKETGLSAEEVKAKYNDYRLARHALERNTTLWATLVPLGSKEAEAKRAALVTSILDGTADPSATMQKIVALAQNSGPAVAMEEGHYGGMPNEDAQAIIDAIENAGLKTQFEKIDQEYDLLVNMMRRWEEEAGTYAGPTKNILDAYGWKYYTPLFNTKEQKKEFDNSDEPEVVDRLFNPVNIVKKTAEGRRSIAHVDLWTNFELAARNAAYRASLARVAQAARNMVEATDKYGFAVQVGKIEEVGRVEYKPGTGDKPPSWHLPVRGATKNPRVFNIYNKDTGKWERLVMYDKDIAKLLRDQLNEDFIFGSRTVDKAMRSVGDLTRWFAKGMTAYNPQYLFTATYRDLVQTSVFLASQKGLNPAKAAATISKRLASIHKGGYAQAMFEFLSADAKRREELANDPEFLAKPGMDRLVERWRNGGVITFSAQVGEAEARVSRGYGAISKKLRQGLRKALGDQAYLTIEGKLQSVENISMLLDNIHRQVAYDMLRESGASPAEAALWSRDIMDFNKRSKAGVALNHIWAFAKAGLIGASTILSNHLWKKGTMPIKVEMNAQGQVVAKFDNDPNRLAKELNLGAVGYFTLAGALRVAIVAALLGNDDEGEPLARKISPGTWMMYEVWPVNILPGVDAAIQEPIKLPKQYGLHQLFEGLGTAFALKTLGLADTQETVLAFSEMLAANFVPLGRLTFPSAMSEGGTVSTGDFVRQMVVNFSPTVATAATEMLVGRDTFGQKIMPDIQFTRAAGHTRSFIGTPLIYQDIAKFANENLGMDVTPEHVELMVRDGIPAIGPILSGIGRLAVGLTSRPERTLVEEILSSSLTPLPKVGYDMRYDFVRVNQYIQSNYIKPVATTIDTIRAEYKHKPAEKERRLQQIYKENPWYRPVVNLRKSYSERLSVLRQAVREARRQGDYEEATQKWREYNELRKRRLAEMVRIMQAHGVEIDY